MPGTCQFWRKPKTADLEFKPGDGNIEIEEQKTKKELSKKWKFLTIVGVVVAGVICLGIILAIVFVLIIPYVKNHAIYDEFEDQCEGSHEHYDLGGSSLLGKYKRFSVAADSEHCSIVGTDILRADGSAVDAAIATALCNGVTHSQSSGIGGGHFMVIYLKEKNKTYAIDAREAAPLSSDKMMFTNGTSSRLGGMASGIPGEVAGFWEAWKLGGKLPWKSLFEPTIKMCRDGFKVTHALAKAIKNEEKGIRADPGLSGVYLNQQTGEIANENDVIKNPKLARTLEIIGAENITAFYNGSLTQIMVDEMNANGASVTVEDFNNYQALVKKPIEVNINDEFKVLSQPPPSSGILVGFIIRLMSKYDLKSVDMSNPESAGLYYHRLIEVFKHSYYFRSLIGDENVETDIEVEKKLMDDTFINQIKAKIDDQKTFPSSYYGDSIGEDTPGTSHMSVLANEDAVALTTTVNLYFGAQYLGQNTGIVYNNEMDDFSTPGLINYFGLKPSVANYIKPGKRPMSSMSPTIILDKNNNVRLVIGASGGSKIITAVAQAALQNLWINENIKDCIDQDRVHHQLYPEYVEVESGADFLMRKSLLRRRHVLKCIQPSSILQGIARLADGRLEANCDVRKGGVPDGE